VYGINEFLKGLVRERTVGYLFLEPPRGGVTNSNWSGVYSKK